MRFKWRDVMLNKFYAFIFALSAIFIISCNQNSEVKGDNPKENKVTNEEVAKTKNKKADNVQIWAIKTDPDGTITKVLREADDGSLIRPKGFEWKKVQGESSRKYLRAPSNFEGNLEEGLNNIEKGKPAIIKFMDTSFENEPEDIDLNRALTLENLADILLEPFLKTVYECDGKLCDKNEAAKLLAKGGDLTEITTKRSDVVVYESLGNRGADVSIKVKAIARASFINENDDALNSETNLLIQIDNDKLDLHVRLHQPSKKENKGFINETSITTKISGDTYKNTNDFFLKLSELGIIRERWNQDNPAFPFGYSFYFSVPHKG
jgi:hypothetical protein